MANLHNRTMRRRYNFDFKLRFSDKSSTMRVRASWAPIRKPKISSAWAEEIKLSAPMSAISQKRHKLKNVLFSQHANSHFASPESSILAMIQR